MRERGLKGPLHGSIRNLRVLDILSLDNEQCPTSVCCIKKKSRLRMSRFSFSFCQPQLLGVPPFPKTNPNQKERITRIPTTILRLLLTVFQNTTSNVFLAFSPQYHDVVIQRSKDLQLSQPPIGIFHSPPSTPTTSSHQHSPYDSQMSRPRRFFNLLSL
jgi:hypothetical protein